MGDILSSGPERPPWRPSRRAIVLAVAVTLVGALVAVFLSVTGGGGRGADARGGPSSPYESEGLPDGPDATSWAGRTPGLLIGDALDAGSALNRFDRTAGEGPYTVVVRRPDGSPGRHGAVVTFPVPAVRSGRPVGVGDVRGWARDGEINWPLGRAYARVRGDLSGMELLAVATATTLIDGRPQVFPPAGLSVAASETYRPHYLREARYRTQDVGESDALSRGLTFTGVAACGGFEDRLYATGARPSGTVHGRPAMLAPELGGNGVLAWEPSPGVVAYVGYSGAQLDEAAVAALHRLAERSRLVSAEDWASLGPQTIEQSNTFG